jgi:hypothetical protein
MADWRHLWGSTLDEVSINLVQGTVTLAITLFNAGTRTAYRAEFQEVFQLHYFNSIELPWNYAELTEIHSETGPDGRVRTELMLWDEDAGLVIGSSSADLVEVSASEDA